MVGLGIIVAAAVISFAGLQAGLFKPSHNQLKQAVAAKLRDPSSAQFRDIYGEGETYCGKVNARNGFGAYAGYRRFVSHRGIVLLEPQLRAGASISEQADHFAEVARFARLQSKCHG